MTAIRHWLSGHAEATFDPEERAIHYGDGVFETVRIRASRPEFIDRHLQRLRAGCQRLQLDEPDWDMLRQEIYDRVDNAGDAVLKVLISRAPGERGYGFRHGQGITCLMSLYPAPQWPQRYRQEGIHVRVCSMRLSKQPRLAGIKHLNRLEQVLARSEWDKTYQEGLMLDSDGQLVEGTMSNVFLLSGDTLVTPLLDQSGVAGVMRSVVLDLAAGVGLKTSLRSISPDELSAGATVFVCNSLIGIWPVCFIEGKGELEIDTSIFDLQRALEKTNTQENGTWYSA